MNTQFSIAVHLMAGLGTHAGEDITSTQLANSVNACPSFVRRVVSKLSKANLVRTTKGKSGACSLARSPEKITLLEIYEAVDAPKAFAIHEYPTQKSCWVSCGIKRSMENVLERTQKSLEDSLKKISLADVITDIQRK